MEEKIIFEFIEKVGFPAVVALFTLVRIDRRLDKIIDLIIDLKE